MSHNLINPDASKPGDGMQMDDNRKLIEYYQQAQFFLRAASLATQHRKEQPDINATVWNDFETVIVGTHHAFAAEILLKGIMIARTGDFTPGHKLTKLVNDERCGELFQELESRFSSRQTGSFSGKSFGDLLRSHSPMFEQMRYACEKQPPLLNMDFTCFLCDELSAILKAHCEETTGRSLRYR